MGIDSRRILLHCEYKPGPYHCNADGLSRLPLTEVPSEIPVPSETILAMDMLTSLFVTTQQIKKWTGRDPTLSKLPRSLLEESGIPKYWDLKPYQIHQAEISVQDDCILWGSCLVVPLPCRSRILEQLQVGHPGTSRMKNLAHSFVWWPGIDREVDETV